MNVLQLVAVLLAALGGLGGLATSLRAKAQNRLDDASGRKVEAEAENIEVRTARELIAEVRAEMDRRVSALDQEIGRLRGHLESTRAERDHLRKVEGTLRAENAQLRERIDTLEGRVRILTAAADAASAVRQFAQDEPAPDPS